MAEATGVAAAVDGLLDDLPVVQPSLFPSDLVADLPDGIEREMALRARPAGRPPGARNKRTEAFRDFVLRRGPHPAEVLIETYSRPVGDLAAELQCSVLEAKRLQNDAARVVLEYTEGKMPVTVNANLAGGIAVIFEGIAASAVPTIDAEHYQALSDDRDDKLDSGELDDGR